ncbi:inositol monophosphatase 2 isoform X2 [Cavia porcellus]|uniref:inositol monophosphatase 2 isoform X2 n=1 Tax=Cavia porcellus TaxID=10141 RepID=UPI002FDF1820
MLDYAGVRRGSPLRGGAAVLCPSGPRCLLQWPAAVGLGRDSPGSSLHPGNVAQHLLSWLGSCQGLQAHAPFPEVTLLQKHLLLGVSILVIPAGEEDLSRALILTEIGSKRDPATLKLLLGNMEQLLLAKAHGVRVIGSSTLALCHLAAGAVDAYYQFGLHCWDLAAATVIVREAGGIVMDTTGLSPQVDPLTSCHAEWLPQAPRRWPHLSPRPCSPSAMNGMTKCEGATGQAPPMQHPSLHCTPGHHRPARPLWARCLLVSDARFLASSRSSPGLQELHAAHPDSGDG